MNPKGKLLIIGGAEDRSETDQQEIREKEHNQQFDRFKILRELLPESHADGKIEVITSASSVPEEMEEMYRNTFSEIGFKNIGFLKITNKDEARRDDNCERIKQARVVFFTGGDQLRVSTIIGGTQIGDMLKERYHTDKDFVIAGTSAGAMIMSEIMICGGGTGEALLGADLHTA